MVYVIRSFWKSGSNFMLEKQRERERQQLKEENGRATLVEEKKKECIPLWRFSLFVLATRWLREFRIFSLLYNSLFECE